ncbi:MAG: hypothetical protein K8R88_08170, partial [Armatimonadetes bacterium]|nr:hypothetical protein [Armatimonadota bacterium]
MRFVSIFASLTLASVACAQGINQGAILRDGNDEFSYGANVNASGISTTLQNLPGVSNSAAGAVR